MNRFFPLVLLLLAGSLAAAPGSLHLPPSTVLPRTLAPHAIRASALETLSGTGTVELETVGLPAGQWDVWAAVGIPWAVVSIQNRSTVAPCEFYRELLDVRLHAIDSVSCADGAVDLCASACGWDLAAWDGSSFNPAPPDLVHCEGYTPGSSFHNFPLTVGLLQPVFLGRFEGSVRLYLTGYAWPDTWTAPLAPWAFGQGSHGHFSQEIPRLDFGAVVSFVRAP